MEILQRHLPSGLAFFAVPDGASHLTQRVDYPTVHRAKSVASPAAPPAQLQPKKQTTTTRASYIPAVIRHIDPLYDVYSDTMKADAEQRFVTHVKEFVGKHPGSALVGRKGSREILAWISSGRSSVPPESFFKLCSFLLDAKICVQSAIHTWSGSNADDAEIRLC
jgi:hypothetical protein